MASAIALGKVTSRVDGLKKGGSNSLRGAGEGRDCFLR
jgi:hypothetical protein